MLFSSKVRNPQANKTTTKKIVPNENMRFSLGTIFFVVVFIGLGLRPAAAKKKA